MTKIGDKRGRCDLCKNCFEGHHKIHERDGKKYHTSCIKKVEMTQKEVYKIVEILEDYTNWLLKNGYTDSDVYAEEPKAVNGYIKEKYGKEI